MMFETLIVLAAAAGAAPSPPQADSCAQPAIEAAPAVNPAVIEMTYDAFVAIEETPNVGELVRPAIGAARARQPALVAPVGTAWIS